MKRYERLEATGKDMGVSGAILFSSVTKKRAEKD
jgi:hypothetical protein